MKIVCEKCGSSRISTERRMNGNSTCLDCGYVFSSPQDLELVQLNQDLENFTMKMRLKLLKKHEEGRRGYKYMSDKELSELLRSHVEKGDPIDVANICMFLSANRCSIQPTAQEDWSTIETAPKDGSLILGFSSSLGEPVEMWWGVDEFMSDEGEMWLSGEGNDWSMGFYYRPVVPTHWRRLPPKVKPPKD